VWRRSSGPEGIPELTRAVAVELVLDRAQRLGTGLDGAVEDRVRVLDVDVQRDRSSPDGLRAERVHVGVLVRQHDQRIADL
jgi:hypothetical protein